MARQATPRVTEYRCADGARFLLLDDWARGERRWWYVAYRGHDDSGDERQSNLPRYLRARGQEHGSYTRATVERRVHRLGVEYDARLAAGETIA